ncbi:MAG: 3-methyl-2-oxobutanoate dehydrogenase subunit VorB [Deltaproteobacteria bacterium]
MTKKILMKGNEAIAEAAVQSGCRHYFGYPITPQTEIAAYMASRMPEVGGVFLQAESEISAINMVYGASSTGVRVMTSSSSPGISLKQEGLSYIAGAELPCVIVNVMRGGPGLGGILPSQSDYFQAVKGGGHGDYKTVVFAPNTVQEMYDFTMLAFDIADKYRITVMILADGHLGQVMEPMTLNTSAKMEKPRKDWALTGTGEKRHHNVITSIHLKGEDLENHNNKLQAKYARIKSEEVKYELFNCENADVIIVAYGSVARIAKEAAKAAEKEGIKVGLLRPITLWPFPDEIIAGLAEKVKGFVVVEMSTGQMLEDVKLAVNGKRPVLFHGRTGGMVPLKEDIIQVVREGLK